jgi:hypothetical protein
MLTPVDQETIFTPILHQIQSGEIKTSHQLRLVLDALSEQYRVNNTLKMLIIFREWLQEQGLDLDTAHGMVTLNDFEE